MNAVRRHAEWRPASAGHGLAGDDLVSLGAGWGGWATLIVLGVGLLDSLAGPAVTVSLLFVVPVAIAAWRRPRRVASALCGASAGVWTALDFVMGRFPPTCLAYAWNISVRLALLLALAGLLGAIRTRARVSARIDAHDLRPDARHAGWIPSRHPWSRRSPGGGRRKPRADLPAGGILSGETNLAALNQ